MSVYFHVNFNLNRERLAGVLSQLIENPDLNEEQIAKAFGFKAPFTKRYKSWLKKCGIIENSVKVNLTDYGKIIYKKDRTLSKEQTLWYMHTFLCHSEDNAEAWNYFYHTYLPKNQSFTKEDLSEAISMKLMPHNPNHFKKNAPMIKVITKVLIDSYISDTGFGPIGILTLKNGVFFNEQKKTTYKWDDIESFNKLY
tara:strand:- start:186 stop:776 length:591 start_codon:yes stop_codon:yes gene_type:complete